MNIDTEIKNMIKNNGFIYIVCFIYFIAFTIMDKGIENTYQLGIICCLPFMEYVMLKNTKNESPQQYEHMKQRCKVRHKNLNLIFNILYLIFIGFIYYFKIIDLKKLSIISVIFLLLTGILHYFVLKVLSAIKK